MEGSRTLTTRSQDEDAKPLHHTPILVGPRRVERRFLDFQSSTLTASVTVPKSFGGGDGSLTRICRVQTGRVHIGHYAPTLGWLAELASAMTWATTTRLVYFGFSHIWSPHSDFRREPAVYKTAALRCLSYGGKLWRRVSELNTRHRFCRPVPRHSDNAPQNLERMTGVEPAKTWLEAKRLTVRPHPHPEPHDPGIASGLGEETAA